MSGSFRKYYDFVAPSYKLELERFLALLKIHDEAECGSWSKKKFGLKQMLVPKKFWSEIYVALTELNYDHVCQNENN